MYSCDSDPHSEFTDDGILRNLDVEFYFLRRFHRIGHAADDGGGSIAIAYCGVDVEAVDFPTLPRSRNNRLSSPS